MAAPTISTDLQRVTDAESTTNWSYIGGPGLAQETDYYIQGSFCVSKQISNDLRGMWFDSGVNVDMSRASDQRHAFVWLYLSTPGLADLKSNGGIRVRVGTTTSDWGEFYVAGLPDYLRGGWIRAVVDLTLTPGNSAGTLNRAQIRYWGGMAQTTASVKVYNLGVDAIDYGTGHAIEGGDGTTPATFQGLVDFDSVSTSRYGVIESPGGVAFDVRGRLTIGNGATATYFLDANRFLTFDDTLCAADFYQILITGSGCVADWTNLYIRASGIPKWALLVEASATFSDTDSTFQSARIISLNSTTTLSGTTVKESGLVTQNGASMADFAILSSTDTVAFLLDDDSVLSRGRFEGNDRAIEITTPGTYTFDGHKFSGNTVDVRNSSTGLVTINVTNGGDSPTYENTNGGTTVVNNSVALQMGGMQQGTEVTVVRDSDGTVLYHLEDVGAGGGATYSYNAAGSVPATINIFHVDYEPIYQSVTLGTDQSVTFSQTLDRNYSNPV